MDSLFLCNITPRFTPISNSKTVINSKGSIFPSRYSFSGLLNKTHNPIFFQTHSITSSFTVNCKEIEAEDYPLSTSSAYDLLGVDPNCSSADLKSAFRSKVKQFHPDVSKDEGISDIMIRRVIRAYEVQPLLAIIRLDPFDEPECEAFDLFVNETLCIGKGCPSSCVKNAPHAFSFVSSTGTARATSQAGNGDDNRVQIAVGRCPRNCIHYVTPSQRIILEELLDSILNSPVNSTAEADILYSLITKAKFENNRYQKPKKQPKNTTQNVDWF
ncbi:DnaJ domain [Macleaya cordata]|uniref:DnaJ domain n=1 Tax=Macleaya cordata TaxID=56857 RepID=A0A200QQ38_MACCD|nr:DnaJ domain [Macleaya cordata]